MGNKNKIKLLPEHVKTLENLPESGMGYQVVTIQLRDKTKLPNRIVLNSTYLQLDENEFLEASDIIDIEMQSK